MDVLPLLNLLNTAPQPEKKGSGNSTDPASSISELIAQFQNILANSTSEASGTTSAASGTAEGTTADGQPNPVPGQTDDSRLDWSLIAGLVQFVPLNQFIPTATQQSDSSPLPQLPAALQTTVTQLAPGTQSPIPVETSAVTSAEIPPIPAIPLLLWNPEFAPQPASQAPATSAAPSQSANTAADLSAPYPPFLLGAAIPGSQPSVDPSTAFAENQLQIRITSSTVSLPPSQNPQARFATTIGSSAQNSSSQQTQQPEAGRSARTLQVTSPASPSTADPSSSGTVPQHPSAQVSAQAQPTSVQFNPSSSSAFVTQSVASTDASALSATQPSAAASGPETARTLPASDLHATQTPKSPESSPSHRSNVVAQSSGASQADQQPSTDLSSSEHDSQSATDETQALVENATLDSTPVLSSQSLGTDADLGIAPSASVSQPAEPALLKATPQARAKRSLSIEDLLKEESPQRTNHILPVGQNPSALNPAVAPSEQLPDASTQSLQPQTISQVTTAAASSLQEASQIQVELNPHDLGRIRVEVSRHEQHLTAKIEVAQSHTHRLLTDSASQLTDALAAQGITVDRVEISYRPTLTENNSPGTATQNFSGGTRNSFAGQDDGSNRRQSQQEPQQQFFRRDPPQQQPPSPQARTARLKDIDIKI